MTANKPSRLVERARGDRGEANLIAMMAFTPVLLGFLILLSAGARNNDTAFTALDAARSAARAGSTAATAADAPSLAVAAFNANLDPDYRGSCSASVDVAAWDAGTITVSVECRADLGQFAALNVAGATGQERVVQRSWTEPVDAARLIRTAP